jgi:hypothetical protein
MDVLLEYRNHVRLSIYFFICIINKRCYRLCESKKATLSDAIFLVDELKNQGVDKFNRQKQNFNSI